MRFFSAVLFLLVAFSILPENVFAQNGAVKITSKKVVYRRKGKDVDPFKRTFTVRYPIIGGVNPQIKRRIEKTINYWRVFQSSLAENLEYTWLYDLDYKVNYNKNNILNISLTQAGSGAYPDEQTENIVVNTKNGARVRAADVFLQSKFKSLAAIVRKKQLLEIKQAARDIQQTEAGENGEQATTADE